MKDKILKQLLESSLLSNKEEVVFINSIQYSILNGKIIKIVNHKRTITNIVLLYNETLRVMMN